MDRIATWTYDPGYIHVALSGPVTSTTHIKKRIAIGAILFEGNSLSIRRDDLSVFRNNYYFEGGDITTRLRGAGVEISGALSVIDGLGHEPVPLIATHGLAGGRVTSDAWKFLKDGLIGRLRAAKDIDGIYLALHGAMLCEGTDDPEGDLLAEIRAEFRDVPLAVSCDLHGHITQEMFRNADVLVGYQLYPHDDTFETGQRATGLLCQMLEKNARFQSAMCKLPMIVPSQRQRTKGDTPMADLYRIARAYEAAGRALSVSYFAVQPWMDVHDLGFAAIAISDTGPGGDPGSAAQVAQDLARIAWSKRHEFSISLTSTREAILAGLKADSGPILLVDASDCVGGGGTGDSASVLAGLLDLAPSSSAATLIVDPEAVELAQEAGPGAKIDIPIGNKSGQSADDPLNVTAEVVRLFEGDFAYTGGIMAGDAASMGPSAWLRVGPVDVVVASRPTYEYSDEQYRAAGFDPNERKFIVVKNPMNYQQAYPQAVAAYVLDTQGPTTPDLIHLDLPKAGRPLFPFDADLVPDFDVVTIG